MILYAFRRVFSVCWHEPDALSRCTVTCQSRSIAPVTRVCSKSNNRIWTLSAACEGSKRRILRETSLLDSNFCSTAASVGNLWPLVWYFSPNYPTQVGGRARVRYRSALRGDCTYSAIYRVEEIAYRASGERGGNLAFTVRDALASVHYAASSTT